MKVYGFQEIFRKVLLTSSFTTYVRMVCRIEKTLKYITNQIDYCKL